jgi:LuxR family transcriptional regulator, maltose regulon positive regulatory protein
VSELISTHWLAFTNVGQRAAVAQWLQALPRDHLLSDGRLCLAQARTASVVGDRDEVLQWVELAENARRHNPNEDAQLAEQATALRSTAWGLLGDMRTSKQLAASLAPFDGSSFWHSLAACNMGAAEHWLDDSAQAAKLFDTSLTLNGDRIAMVSVFALGQLALIAADRGDWRACAAHVEAGFDVVRTRGLEEYWQCCLVHVAHARLLRHDRRLSEAYSELERGAALARRGAGLVELAYVLVTLAELLRERGDRRAARELVLEARELISRAPEPGTFVPRLVAQAERGLRLVLHPSGAGAVATDELTAREHAVLRLLPSGLSAREIGSELGISRDTIKTHTKSIYRKLGASSRRDAVARARDLDLL